MLIGLCQWLQDETGVYKNLLQEIAQRVGSPLPKYTTFKSWLGHHPFFTGMVELAGIVFTGEHAKTKKQAEKNAAMAAWTSLKQLAQQDSTFSSEIDNDDELEQIKIARALMNYRLKKGMGMANSSSPLPFERKIQFQNPSLSPNRSLSPRPRAVTTSKILPLICPKSAPRATATSPSLEDGPMHLRPSLPLSKKFPAPGAAPYMPIRHCGGIAPAVTVRSVVPVFSAPPLPPPPVCLSQPVPPQPVRIAPPVSIRQSIPVFATPPVQSVEPKSVEAHALPHESSVQPDETEKERHNDHAEGSEAVKLLDQLKI